MLDAANQALSFSQGQTRRSLDENPMLLHSLVRLIEVTGEGGSLTGGGRRAPHRGAELSGASPDRAPQVGKPADRTRQAITARQASGP